MKNRVELCCHTKMSKLYGINSAEEYIEEAIKRGYKQIAITDKDSTQAFFEANEYLKCHTDNKDFKIIYGIEMKFKENKNSENSNTIYIYVKEQKGLKNLYKLVSKSYRNIVNGQPMIYKEDLNSYREGLLFAAIGRDSEVYKNIDNSNISNILNYYDFVGIEPNQSNKNTNQKIDKICRKLNKTLIGTSECNFINKEDGICNEILNFYKKSNNIEEGNNRYFQDTEELINNFDYIENAREIVVENSIKIAEQIEKIELINNKASYPNIELSDTIISKKCYDKANEIYGKTLPKEIKDRLELELNSIIKNNFQTIYLICSELVEKSNELGYEVGSRGAVGCSFVAYLLDITNINPIEYNLPFEMFAGKNYDKEPDIDLNFSGEIQSKLFSYLQGKYGKDNVIWAGTIGTLANKSLLDCCKEYEKTFEIKYFQSNENNENSKNSKNENDENKNNNNDNKNNDNKNNENKNKYNKEDIVNKLVGVKRATGEHPGGVFIIPENLDITDFCPTEIGEKGHIKTHLDYHSLLNTGLYKFDILSHDDPTMLHELEKETNISSRDINFDDEETLNLFMNANNKSYNISLNGIPEFGTDFVKEVIEISKPRNFNDLVCISALSHGTNTWNYNASSLIEREDKKLDEVISNREDMYNYLVSNGIDKDLAYDIVNFVRAGKASKGRSLWKHISDRYKDYNDKWNEYKNIMKEHNIPDWYIHSAEKIAYMFPKSHAIGYTANAFKIAWYKVHYPKAFYKTYFKIKSDLNINDYYCKRQVKTELNRLLDEKETFEMNNEYDYDFCNNDKIKDLELILEMYNNGILKEKVEIKDDYNLINSRTIADYCRSIKHKFNTIELAVLVYRNNRMSIDEKIEKYNDLIKNYPDMEVIEKINCKHYSSVKTMIKEEIQRLNTLNKKLTQENDDSIYVWTEYNKSTLKYEHSSDLEHTFRTYKEVFKDIQDYIKEYDDTISFRITKKYFDKRKNNIFADYLVENKKSKLIDLTESNNCFFDIDQIFLNIPTPFKKGDILISKSSSMRNYGDCDEIFVLDYLCTWREDLEEQLARGNYDSSDMVGYGYYLYGENSTDFVRDNKWDYDSFEYYDGEFTGNDRILKDISSFVKGKIGLELFVHTYDVYKAESKCQMPDFYTDEGLKLAGMNESDILKINHPWSD